MDLNRFSMATERKIAGDSSSYRQLKKEISLNNLNQKQRLLLLSPRAVIVFIKKLQLQLLQFGVYITSY